MVTSLHPLASMAGMRILTAGRPTRSGRRGGRLRSPSRWWIPRMSSIGGQGFATIYVASKKEVRAINFFGPSPRSSTLQAFAGKDYTRGILSSPVPSCLRGYWELHRTYGKLALERRCCSPPSSWPSPASLCPATIEPTSIRDNRGTPRPVSLHRRKSFCLEASSADGRRSVRAGRTWRGRCSAWRQKGADDFYEGPIADSIATFLQAAPADYCRKRTSRPISRAGFSRFPPPTAATRSIPSLPTAVESPCSNS